MQNQVELKNVSKMVDYTNFTTTAHIHCTFGAQSIAPRQLICLLLDRVGVSLEVFTNNWAHHCKDLGWQQAFERSMQGVRAGIDGWYLTLFPLWKLSQHSFRCILTTGS